jgi:hypothetical protein
MAFFNRRKVQVEIQRPVAEPPVAVPSISQELAGIDQKLREQAALDRPDRDPKLIDKLLAERAAVARAMVPVIPGRAS